MVMTNKKPLSMAVILLDHEKPSSPLAEPYKTVPFANPGAAMCTCGPNTMLTLLGLFFSGSQVIRGRFRETDQARERLQSYCSMAPCV